MNQQNKKRILKMTSLDDLQKLQIGAKVIIEYLHSCKSTLAGTKSNGKVVYIFNALTVPDSDKLIKYYGEEIISLKHEAVFGPMKTDRIVIKKGKDDYSIIHRSIKTLNYLSLTVL